MRRRDFVRIMVGAAAVPQALLGQTANPTPPLPAPVPWTQGLTASTPLLKTQIAEEIAQTDLRFFTVSQMATLERLSDVFVPSLDDKPGAIVAGVPAFLDFLVGSSPVKRRQLYQGGLDWLEAESMKQFSRPFAQLTTAEADRILQPWMRSWMSDHPPTEAHADFINIAHADIRTATVNSKAWSEAPAARSLESTPVDLFWSPIEPDIYGEARAQVSSRLRGGKAPL